MSSKILSFFAFILLTFSLRGQSLMLGADLSYVNEMEDCGVVYKVQDQPRDPYQIFAENGCNLARFRLWHTPSWYDTLNAGKRYSDFQDVRKSIQRAKTAGMKVLLDFHLSDFWADPNRQLAPAAWWGVTDHLPALKDSVYQHITGVLLALHSEGLLPEMVQIGNETNRGILLSPAVDAAGWSLDWNRNSQLFKRAIEAVRDVENTTGQPVKVALHIAGPADAWWLLQGFWNNGVTDFDIIGLSYYWAWHQPTEIEDAANVVTELQLTYPGKEVMIFETGYIWTTQWNDNAANIITSVHPDYSPASPENQRKWLIDMTQAVVQRGAMGVIYWEPAWQSSPCRTPWGQGSHQEHATFFDFQNNLMADGGIRYYDYPYVLPATVSEPLPFRGFRVWPDSGRRVLTLQLEGFPDAASLQVKLLNSAGKLMAEQNLHVIANTALQVPIPEVPSGLYYIGLYDGTICLASRGIVLGL